ncbi:MAG: PDDEXK nuclease domain-containing protein [Candidatus Margulisiibacteriota bacterium]
MPKIAKKSEYSRLIANIRNVVEQGRNYAYLAVNSILVKTYWSVGRLIVEHEQKGAIKSEYGSELISKLSTELKRKLGTGFSRSNLQYMRLMYLKYPKSQTVSGKLSWSHYVEFLGVSDDLARSFYEKQCVLENWSVRELNRQINSMLFERIALSKKKKGIIKLARMGHRITKESDIVKEPYTLEFLGLPEKARYSERDLEQRIIDKLQMFLLEIGRGFSFVKRQSRMTLDNKHYYVDLVFYHRILKCFVLIDLKIGKASHLDVGQMNMYLNYFAKEENTKGDNPPIGIILAADKDDVLVEYALGGITNKLFVSKYELYLPDKEELRNKVKLLLSQKKNG